MVRGIGDAARDELKHLVAGSLRSFPPDSWSWTVLSGKANDKRNRGRDVFDLFSNFKWIRSNDDLCELLGSEWLEESRTRCLRPIIFKNMFNQFVHMMNFHWSAQGFYPMPCPIASRPRMLFYEQESKDKTSTCSKREGPLRWMCEIFDSTIRCDKVLFCAAFDREAQAAGVIWLKFNNRFEKHECKCMCVNVPITTSICACASFSFHECE